MVHLKFLEKIVLNTMRIGYARVSSNTQDLELQKQALLQAGCSKIFSESISGKDNNRTQVIAMD
jgi:DNA invertase Pin-like site-specific DNA recombinase